MELRLKHEAPLPAAAVVKGSPDPGNILVECQIGPVVGRNLSPASMKFLAAHAARGRTENEGVVASLRAAGRQ